VRALVVDAFGAAPELRQVPNPSCPSDGVVIDVRATGLCRSDWHAWAGHDATVTLPHVPGHEFAGVVAEVGPTVNRVRVGSRVTVPFVCACGQCPSCQAGAGQVCEAQFQPGFTGWGSFAEQVAIPRADINVIELPDELGFDVAAGLGCRFATAYRAVVAHGRVLPSHQVAVFGCGGVGLSAIMIAAARGAHVVAIDVSPAALELARVVGAAETVCSPDAAERVRELTAGGAHLAVDALGSSQTCRSAIESLRPRGRHVQVGLMVGADANAAIPMDLIIARELELYGSHGMAASEYPAMLAEITAGHINPGTIVTGQTGLTELGQALVSMGDSPPTGTLIADPSV
jgi:D-arabinose 1-dehydrogenase-like Zn-dependent alcohol dehydrogenase